MNGTPRPGLLARTKVKADAQLCMIGGTRTGLVAMFEYEGETINFVLELDQAGELAEKMLAEIKRGRGPVPAARR